MVAISILEHGEPKRQRGADLRVWYAAAGVDQADQAAGELRQPTAGAGLSHRVRVPGVHLPVPADRSAGLRNDLDRLRAGRAVRGAQEPEALPVELPR